MADIMALSLVLAGNPRDAGDTRETMWMIRLPLAYYLTLITDLGAVGVWIAMIVSIIIPGLLMARRFHNGYWKDLTAGYNRKAWSSPWVKFCSAMPGGNHATTVQYVWQRDAIIPSRESQGSHGIYMRTVSISAGAYRKLQNVSV